MTTSIRLKLIIALVIFSFVSSMSYAADECGSFLGNKCSRAQVENYRCDKDLRYLSDNCNKSGTIPAHARAFQIELLPRECHLDIPGFLDKVASISAHQKILIDCNNPQCKCTRPWHLKI